jgi:hypothetical protein
LVKSTLWVSEASVPHEKFEDGVQACEVAGAAPEPAQLLSATGVPSERRQVTVWVWTEEPVSATHVAVRVCAVVPQPVAGLQEEYCHEPVPPEQAPKPEADQLKAQPVNTETVCVVAGAVPVHSEASTAVPSERVQVLVRVSVALVEQVEEGADQADDVQL